MKALSGRLKRCKWKGCAAMFKPERTLQQVCSPACGIRLANEKESREWTRQAKERIKTRQDWLREAQDAFNKWVRERDNGKPCISCGEMNPPDLHGGQWDAGHFISVGSHPELRFEEQNCHRQCKSCNGGSKFPAKQRLVTERYEENLITLIGAEKVAWLKGPHEAKKYTIDDFKEIKARYTKLARELKRARA